MKMKKMLATVMATALAVTMIPAAAFASGSDPIDWNNNNGTDQREGAGTVRQPIIEVTLPGDLAFEVDPLKLNSKAQIVGGDYAVINHSEMPIQVEVTPFIVKEDGSSLEIGTAFTSGSSQFVSANEIYGYKPLTSSQDKKKVTLYSVVADKATGDISYDNEGYRFTYKGTSGVIGKGSKLSFNQDGSINYTSVSANTAGSSKGVQQLQLHEINATNIPTNETFSFILGRDVYDESGNPQSLDTNGNIKAAYNNIASSFTVVGAVDPTATFGDGEIAIAANFKMTILTDDKLDGRDNDDVEFYGSAVSTATGVTKAADAAESRQQLKK